MLIHFRHWGIAAWQAAFIKHHSYFPKDPFLTSLVQQRQPLDLAAIAASRQRNKRCVARHRRLVTDGLGTLETL